MTREELMQAAVDYMASGAFLETLARRVSYPTESLVAERAPQIMAYLTEEMVPSLQALGFECRIVDNPVPGKWPFLLARRIEPEAPFTLLTYGHGDVVLGDETHWLEGVDPWKVTPDGDRWYGRGTADNKGQHTINLAALMLVLKARKGRLGYNLKLILEMGEETGSPGLDALCAHYSDWLAADLFIASDGPRVVADRPTLFLGSRGVFNVELQVKLREGAHHSGNWGGLLANPGIRLAHALSSIVDARGRILVPGLRPAMLPEQVRYLLRDIALGGGPDDPAIDPDWNEPGLTAAEKLYSWNTFDILAFTTGNPDKPAHAIPPVARAHCHMRYVPGSDVDNFPRYLREHLDAHGFDDVTIVTPDHCFTATRLDPGDPWVAWVDASIARTTGKKAAILPNFGGGLPNACFSETLGLPTLWVPHSYPACSQHAPNEHLLQSVAQEALQLMAGILWDLADQGEAVYRQREQQLAVSTVA